MDIVERLRSWRKDDVCAAADEAADEIERLRKRVADVDDLLTIAYLQGAADAKRGS